MAKSSQSRLRNPKRVKDAQATGKGKILAARAARQVEREWTCFEMRKLGHSIHDIAITIKVSDAVVRKCLETVMTRMVKDTNENVEEARQLQMERLDAMLVKYSRMAHGYSEIVDVQDPNTKKMVKKEVTHAPNMGAASIVLAIESRRSKLLALDTPEGRAKNESAVRQYVGVDMEQV